ncbi:integral membrane protein [Histoplasma ohiense]|nr:integral membrane protein [Histoplasma ohiense (nom. inval.)]
MDRIESAEAAAPPEARPPQTPSNVRNASIAGRSRRPSIRVLRFPSSSGNSETLRTNPQNDRHRDRQDVPEITTRRRSSSDPRPFVNHGTDVAPAAAGGLTLMPSLVEELSNEETVPQGSALLPPRGNLERLRRTSAAAISSLGLTRAATVSGHEVGIIEDQVVDLLDVIDPEISTLTTLTNVQNSLFVPDLGRFLNRRPSYLLTPRTEGAPKLEEPESDRETLEGEDTDISERLRLQSTSSTMIDELCFAVLPDGETLAGWSEVDKLELNDHVRHMLHSRRSKFKRSMKGFGQYVRKPLGFLVTLYATLITLFGLAWVLFLIGWINVGGRQLYIINVIDNVLVALFAVVGDGLAPFRAIDTYHMIFVARYAHMTWRLRKEKALPKLHNKNDLPKKRIDDANQQIDMEMSATDEASDEKPNDEAELQEYSVLNAKQQKSLEHHQKKLSRSHTFYKPHETSTHTAFPLRLLIAIVVLLDFHSIFQIALGACTWGIYYKVRPFALTTVILCCSITCNVMGGVLIWVGDRRSRKKDVIEKMFRQELTQEAMKKVDRRRRKDRKRESMDERRKVSHEGESGG